MSQSKYLWKVLQNAIINKKLTEKDDDAFVQSVRRFSSFQLFEVSTANLSHSNSCDQCNKLSDSNHSSTTPSEWLCYKCPLEQNFCFVLIANPSQDVHLKELSRAHVDNTGNVCVWPAEEVMAFYCWQRRAQFDGRSVAEVGGGKSCLAGMCLALNAACRRVLLTDGNASCVDNVQNSIRANFDRVKCDDLSCSVLRWGDARAADFDYVLCADCLFFADQHENLTATIAGLMKPGGKALLFAPRRGGTLGRFVDLCGRRFAAVDVRERYCERVTRLHERAVSEVELYDADLHYPLMIELVK